MAATPLRSAKKGGTRMKRGAIASSAVLLLLAAPALAQDANVMDGVGLIDLVIADDPQSFLDDQQLANALRNSIDPARQSDNSFLKGDVRAAIASAFSLDAQTIIDGFSLGGVPGMQFDTVGNKAAAEQDGLGNLVRVGQRFGNAGWAVVNQSGSNNAAFIEQADTGAAGQRSLNRAYVGQVSAPGGASSAYSTKATVRQTHSSFDMSRAAFTGSNLVNTATIQQGGYRSNSFREVAVTPNAISVGNDALVEQTGAENDAVIQQGFEQPMTWSAEAGDTIGRNNRAITTQFGYGNRSVALQEDDGITLTQQYGSDNRAFVRQDGDVMDGAQFSVIEQGPPHARSATGNLATVFQRGMAQSSTIRQHGGDHDAYVSQTAEAAYAQSAIDQMGLSNYASVYQFAPSVTVGEAVASMIVQNGTANEAFVSQSTHSATSTIMQNGNNNFARVRQ